MDTRAQRNPRFGRIAVSCHCQHFPGGLDGVHGVVGTDEAGNVHPGDLVADDLVDYGIGLDEHLGCRLVETVDEFAERR